jgi:choline dehydrogenase-like flavoprotein
MEVLIGNFAEAIEKTWDIVIIGSGMGGGAAAYFLTLKGYKVLLIEKGYADFYAQSPMNVKVEEVRSEGRLSNGHWPTQLTAKVDRHTSNLWIPLGCGLGGSTLLYGAALERFQPEDFAERLTPNGEKIGWPFSYQELEVYYQKAEHLLSVCGTPDPLDKKSQYQLLQPPEMCEIDRQLFQSFQEHGCNPYRLHVGIKYSENCWECIGRICIKNCKQNAYNSFILPALKTGNLVVIDRTEVVKLDADRVSVKSIQVKREEKLHNIKGKIIILSAGAYFTPVLLQRSNNHFWPNGLANDNDLVGRNLMFHASDFIAIWHKGNLANHKPRKTIGIRDFYHYNDHKLGQIQSTGVTASYGYVLYYLRNKFDGSRIKKIPLLRSLLRIPAYLGVKLFNEASIFATIVEDFPYLENRVLHDETSVSGMRFEYAISEELTYRTKLMRRLLVETLKSHYIVPLDRNVALNYGHPCGTCKAGCHPASSVVDKNCKVHALDNLYITDASVMPTSAGTNPSLTVAANALRVAEGISQRFKN